MDRRIIITNDLTINDIPDPDANWHEISLFALTFDPMLELGTADIYKTDLLRFDESASILELRTTLFLLQRGANHIGDISPEGLRKVRGVIRLIKRKMEKQHYS